MHKHGFFHRDIKPENLLVRGDVCKVRCKTCPSLTSSPPQFFFCPIAYHVCALEHRALLAQWKTMSVMSPSRLLILDLRERSDHVRLLRTTCPLDGACGRFDLPASTCMCSFLALFCFVCITKIALCFNRLSSTSTGTEPRRSFCAPLHTILRSTSGLAAASWLSFSHSARSFLGGKPVMQSDFRSGHIFKSSHQMQHHRSIR